MMTFYSAAGSYRLKRENGGRRPYIQRLGKLHPISVPEFAVWSSLLWQVMTYGELEKAYSRQMAAAGAGAPPLDRMLRMLVQRRLVVKGEGYTGMDALYSMLSEAFIVPTVESRAGRLRRAVGLFLRGRISFRGLRGLMREPVLTEDQDHVMRLVRQTPLSVSELIQCFNREITDVSTPEKVITGIYPDEDSCQAGLAAEMYPCPNARRVLEAVSNLYLQRHVLLEQI